MTDRNPGLAPLRGLLGLLAGAATGYLFTAHAAWAARGGVPAAVLLDGEPLVSLHALATVGWALMVLAPLWFWVLRPAARRVRRPGPD
ncbi:MAG: hypothetical protein ABEJ76_09300 [Halanaeroarchaeum sp.]